MMNRTTRSVAVRGRDPEALKPLVVANNVALVLMAGLATWGIANGRIFDTSGDSAGLRTLIMVLSIVSILVSLGTIRSVQRAGSSEPMTDSDRAGTQNRSWQEPMHVALRLITDGKNEASRQAGLVILEHLSEAPDASAAEQEMLRNLVKSLKSDLARAGDS